MRWGGEDGTRIIAAADDTRTGWPRPGIRFLHAEPVDSGAVRKPILASWWRSRQWHVAADHIELDYLHDPDLETRLARSAEPVLRQPARAAGGQPISIILTDAAGLVLTRLTADHDLERAPGRHQAGPRLQLRRGARRHQRHRHRAGVRRPGPRLRARALRRAPGAPRLRRGADPRPGLGQDGRRDRPDLLAQERRPAADLAGQVHRRPDHPGPAGRGQQPGPAPAAGVRAGLPPDRRHRAGPRQRRRHAERPRPPGCSTPATSPP